METRIKFGSALLVALVLAGCEQAARDDAGNIIESGDLDVFSLKVGDCTNDPDDGDYDAIVSVAAVPCSEPHDNEFYASFDVSFDEFPGDEAVSVTANEGCLKRFEKFAGIEYESSILDIFPMYPTAESWAQGDREVICAVFHMEYEKLTGSVQGLGI